MHILSRACNQAQLIEPDYANTFFSYLGNRAGVGSLVDINGHTLSLDEMKVQAASYSASRSRERPYEVVDGLAILPVSGTLLHKYGYIQPRSGSTGYDGILARLEEAIGDPEISAVFMDIDSPGGELSGCFDATARIRQLREMKPIYALCYDTMCSAAMSIGSACTERWITQSGRAGSVGVVVAHANLEEQLKANGIQITLLHSGKHKVDGNPYQNLPKNVRESIQANLDRNRDLFAQIVSDNIGLSKDAVLDTEARVYQGQDAIDIGFANKLVNGAEAVPLLLDVINTKQTIGVAMSHKEPSAKTETDAQQQLATAKAEGATEERDRCKSILMSDEAKQRSTMAHHLTFNTDMSADDAISLLAVSAEEKVDKSESQSRQNSMKDALTEAMAGTEQPNLETTGDGDELSANLEQENVLLGAYNKATGG